MRPVRGQQLADDLSTRVRCWLWLQGHQEPTLVVQYTLELSYLPKEKSQVAPL